MGLQFSMASQNPFYFPSNTPTVVASSFCVQSLFKAFDITGNESYKANALSHADFILNDLSRTHDSKGNFILSYSPINGNNRVINASLLGAKSLAYCYQYSQKSYYKDVAKKIIEFVIQYQEEDGSWIYGLDNNQGWKDSFHTGYNLEALKYYENFCNDTSFKNNIEIGFNYYLNNFFDEITSVPKYYHNKVYPIDIHCPGQLWITSNILNMHRSNQEMLLRVFDWTIQNMMSSKGFFYYQKKRYTTSKISYMRWSNAFTFRALTYYLRSINDF